MTKRRGRGEGSVYQRSDGRWEGRLDLGWEGGKRRRKYVYGRTQVEAAAKLRKAQRALEEGTLIADERTTLQDFLDVWLTAVKPTVRPSTWRRYEQYSRSHIVPVLGKVRVARLTPQHLQCLYADRLASGLSAQTVVHVHRTIHRALSYALRWGLVVRNVAALADPPRVERHQLVALSPQEGRRLLDAARDDRLEALYVLALTTGMRRGELLALHWDDVDLDGHVLRVRRSLQLDDGGRFVLGDPKTAGSRRPVVLTGVAVHALRLHRERQEKERAVAGDLWRAPGLVFTNTIGGPIQGGDLLKRQFYPLLARAGLRRIRFHDLRHSTATFLLASGIHPKIVSDMLGHSRTAITLDLYSHSTPAMHRQAADILEQLFGSQDVSQEAGDQDDDEPDS